MLYEAFKKEMLQLLALSNDKVQSVVAAFSGGADSVALLHLLWRLEKEKAISLSAVHIEHGIRGRSSLDDAEFAKKICEKLVVPLEIVHISVPDYVEKHSGISVEEAARVLRYRALKERARSVNSNLLLFGHHSDDQVETILLNILRGSGISGLRGIPKTRKDEEFYYFRPLLGFSKKDILDYCKSYSLEYVEDETNFEADYKRNRIRLELLPILETYNPSIKNALLKLSQTASETEDFINEKMAEVMPQAKRCDKYLAFDLKDYDKMPTTFRKQYLRNLVKEITGNFPDYSTTVALEQIAENQAGSRYLRLSSRLVVSREYDMVYLAKDFEFLPEPKFLFNKDENGLYSLGDCNVHRDWQIKVEFVTEELVDLRKSTPYLETLDEKKLLRPLMLRTRKAGDVFYPLGAKGPKKLKDFFIDLKIPKRIRGRIPLVVDANDQIIWVVGFRISDLVKVDENTEKYLTLRIVQSCHAGSPVL
ncbi:MAG: tRNA lysidine(34) synthetase TilS [Firmicutes bacterium]|nr:tRNA lysidine(34) synthetase TilS [Bacillota bacterium]MDD4693777.1 tRNA lysidine(34) synthetase TilS [Bacillota bacterium]